MGRLILLKKLRASNIPHTIPDKQDRRDGSLLREASEITRDQTKAEGESGAKHRDQPDAYQPAPFLLDRELAHEEDADEADEQGDDHPVAAKTAEAVAGECAEEEEDQGYCCHGDGVEEGVEANQMQLLRACSEGVYHMPTTMVKPGLMALSKTPSSTRRVVMPAKLEAAAWHVKMIAQMILGGLAAGIS
ncbi:hypothetical protein APSETT444_007431 [Aspergillus pseudonomiae]